MLESVGIQVVTRKEKATICIVSDDFIYSGNEQYFTETAFDVVIHMSFFRNSAEAGIQLYVAPQNAEFVDRVHDMYRMTLQMAP